MGFKDIVNQDVTTFLDPSFLAESHLINGSSVDCCVDVSIIEGAQGQGRDGLFQSQKTIFLAASALIQRPVRGERIAFDEEFYFVESCSEESGILKIVMGANDQ